LLPDPDDEAFAHLAFEVNADYLVTHNQKHYEPAKERGIRAVTPREFLRIVRSGL
jgi:predicted nucleic acid-binding protein